MDQNGRIVLPAEVRRRLAVGPGDEVVLELGVDEVRVTSRAVAIRAAQALVKRHRSGSKSLVADLLEQRRRETRGG